MFFLFSYSFGYSRIITFTPEFEWIWNKHFSFDLFMGRLFTVRNVVCLIQRLLELDGVAYQRGLTFEEAGTNISFEFWLNHFLDSWFVFRLINFRVFSLKKFEGPFLPVPVNENRYHNSVVRGALRDHYRYFCERKRNEIEFG